MATSGKAIAGVRETRKGATIHKTNERPGTRAQVRYVRVSAYKAREVLDLIRGKHVADADEILQFVERDIAMVVRKGLASAVANAANNDAQDPEALFVSACYADEGPTLKRWRPRARGRATRIRKRTCHITIIVSRLGETQLRLRSEAEARSGRAGGGAAGRASRRARVAESRKAETHDHDHDHDDETLVDDVGDGSTAVEELATDAAIETTDAEVDTTDAEVDTAEVETDTADAETDAEVVTDAPAGDIKGNRESMKYHVPGSQWYEQTDAEEWFATTSDAEAAGYEPAGGASKQQLEGHEIKGNRDSMKYHVPGSQWYEQTEAEEWFATAEDAEAAGYEPAGGADKQDVETDEKDED